MWSTPNGDRNIRGHEAFLIREAVGMMIDELELLADQTAFPPLEFGIPVWDGLTWQQKLATLDQVLRHLLDPKLPPLPLMAVYESAIGAIFEKIKGCIEVELDMVDSETESEFHDLDSWRELILNALNEPHYIDDNDFSSMESDRIDDLESEIYPSGCHDTRKNLWFNVVDRLADRLLWDRDYEMEAVFGDVEPDNALALKNYVGISQNYFRHIAPDLRDDQVFETMERVKAITHSHQLDDREL